MREDTTYVMYNGPNRNAVHLSDNVRLKCSPTRQEHSCQIVHEARQWTLQPHLEVGLKLLLTKSGDAERICVFWKIVSYYCDIPNVKRYLGSDMAWL